MLGKIVLDGVDPTSIEFDDPNIRNLVNEVSCKVRKESMHAVYSADV